MSKVLNRNTYLSKNVGDFQDTIESSLQGCSIRKYFHNVPYDHFCGGGTSHPGDFCPGESGTDGGADQGNVCC